jgi:hypothetical protein
MKYLYTSRSGDSEDKNIPPIEVSSTLGENHPHHKEINTNTTSSLWGKWQQNTTEEFWGFLPNCVVRRKRLEKELSSSTDTAYYSVAYLCLLVISRRGYSKFQRMHSAKLKSLLGSGYMDVLEATERAGLIKLRRKASHYDGEKASKKHTQIYIVGRRGSWGRVRIENKPTVNRIQKYRASRLKNGWSQVMELEYKSLMTSQVGLEGFDALNLALSSGVFFPTMCGFGRRVHCVYTYKLKKGERSFIYSMDAPNEKTVEPDITSSQAFFLFQCKQNTELLEIAFKDTVEREKLERVFNNCYWKKDLRTEYETALRNGRFYEDFLGDVLDTCCGGSWIPWLREKLKEEKDPEEQKMPKTRRDRIKKVMMYLMFGGGTELLQEIKQNDKYGRFGKFLLDIRKVQLNERSPDLYGLKKEDPKKRYHPRKNLCIILQRIEAHFIQRVFVDSGITWGILIHDSVMCLQKEQQLIVDAFSRVSEEMGIETPQTTTSL